MSPAILVVNDLPQFGKRISIPAHFEYDEIVDCARTRSAIAAMSRTPLFRSARPTNITEKDCGRRPSSVA